MYFQIILFNRWCYMNEEVKSAFWIARKNILSFTIWTQKINWNQNTSSFSKQSKMNTSLSLSLSLLSFSVSKSSAEKNCDWLTGRIGRERQFKEQQQNGERIKWTIKIGWGGAIKRGTCTQTQYHPVKPTVPYMEHHKITSTTMYVKSATM